MLPFSRRSARALVRLLLAHTVVTLSIWAPIAAFAHIDLGISNVYLASSVALLALTRVRRLARRRRRP